MTDLTDAQIAKIDYFIASHIHQRELSTMNLFSQAVYGIVLNYNTSKIKSYGLSEILQIEIITMRASLGLD